MRLYLAILAMVLAIVSAPRPAQAYCNGMIPYVFVNNVTIVDASTTNANNAYLLGCATTVDYTQIGTSGIFASQILPLNIAEAQFGGSVNYAFPLGLNVAGAFQAGNACTLSGSAGDGAFCRSSTTGQVTIGAGTVDYNLTTSAAFTMSGPLLATASGTGVPAYVGTNFNNATGNSVIASFHHVIGTLGATTSASCAAGVVCAMTGGSAVVFNPSFVNANVKCQLTPNNGTGASPTNLFFPMYYSIGGGGMNIAFVSESSIPINAPLKVDYDCSGPIS
jgi:hypothetical protein